MVEVFSVVGSESVLTLYAGNANPKYHSSSFRERALLSSWPSSSATSHRLREAEASLATLSLNGTSRSGPPRVEPRVLDVVETSQGSRAELRRMWGIDRAAVFERREARVYGCGMVPMVKRVLLFS